MKHKDKIFALFTGLREAGKEIRDDNITVYAAQASFFVIISTMPFLSLLVSILSFFVSTDILRYFEKFALPDEVLALVGSVIDELRTAPTVSLLSFSAIIILWTASKGMGAIRKGIETAYRVGTAHSFFFQKILSLISTIVFIVLIVASVVVLLFGEFLLDLLHIPWLTSFIMQWRVLFFILFMCVVFTAMYASTARQGGSVKANLLHHLPGAVFASVGWILFSYFYSLYIKYFPNASYIYGGLAAVCLIMLWLYFCMIILLLGAEVNKFCFRHIKKKVK